MEPKDELIALIEELPESQIPQAIIILKRLIEKQQENEMVIEQEQEQAQPEVEQAQSEILQTLAPIDIFMATIVNSLTNIMYDLSLDAKRKEEKVMANRLESYRKKVSDGWEIYKKSK